MLSPRQFKMSLGREDLTARDSTEPVKAPLHPDTSKPPVGYYSQPSSNVRQMALPGMEMSEQDHLDALSDRVGGQARVNNGDNYHMLTVHHPDGVVSNLLWGAARKAHPVRDVGQPSSTGPAGEVRSVTSYQKGTASAMLSTAEALAHEHGYTFPRHSQMRSSDGVHWTQAMMKRRGEKVW